MTAPWNFESFLKRMAALDDVPIIIAAAALECEIAETASHGKDGPRNRALGSLTQSQRIKEFLWYMRHGTRPHSPQDFASYRPVIAALVAKNKLPSDALERFDRQRQ